ncbi:response regulator transcription factor [Citroniella saccharovorans]|uniref:Response regulator transcription factor n=1 Tax=Citroniella saccharovorans TaxID=2053367 RepID=A0AAW9MSQ1_9FIRM|nr:response regulator transcription factor [Citroniella saccharovorans]MEB3430204.1 response regulator transcription factor [Citroniella saccharovorans]
MDKIFVVEDDDNIRELICYALDTSGYSAKGFSSSKSLYLALEKEKPSLFLLDIMLGEDSGYDILDKIRHDSSLEDIPVIMLTAKTAEYDKVKGLDMGADDYITKPFGVLELISRIKAVLRRVGKDETPEGASSYKKLKIDPSKRTVEVDGNGVELTFKEFELLTFLLNNQGIVLSRDKIMTGVWGFDYQGESRTVDVHIRTLRQKLGEAGEYIVTVRNVGYKLGE